MEEDRPAWKRLLLSLVYTVGIAALLILAAGLMVVGPTVLGWVATPLGLGPLAILLLMAAVGRIASAQKMAMSAP